MLLIARQVALRCRARLPQTVLYRPLSSDVDHHHPGPMNTMDDMPVPFKPYKQEYDRLQTNFNYMLAVGVAMLGGAMFMVRFVHQLLGW